MLDFGEKQLGTGEEVALPGLQNSALSTETEAVALALPTLSSSLSSSLLASHNCQHQAPEKDLLRTGDWP